VAHVGSILSRVARDRDLNPATTRGQRAVALPLPPAITRSWLHECTHGRARARRAMRAPVAH